MDKFKELTTGAKLVLGAAVALFIVSLFNWFKVGDIGVGTMWSGIGVIAGLFLLALIVWQGLRLANIELEIGVTPSMITAALAVLTLVFVFIRWISKPGGSAAADVVDRTFWSWLGLALAIVLVIGAWLNMQAAGEGLAHIKSTVTGATAAARGAVDRDDPPPAAAAPAPPAAPPVETPAAVPPEPPSEPIEPDDAPRAS
jgi:hypothetical protein